MWGESSTIKAPSEENAAPAEESSLSPPTSSRLFGIDWLRTRARRRAQVARIVGMGRSPGSGAASPEPSHRTKTDVALGALMVLLALYGAFSLLVTIDSAMAGKPTIGVITTWDQKTLTPCSP